MIPTHLIGLSEEEAIASIEEHGDPPHCRFKDCRKAVAVALLMKKPGAAWGQDIQGTGACEEHAPGLEEIIARVVHHD